MEMWVWVSDCSGCLSDVVVECAVSSESVLVDWVVTEDDSSCGSSMALLVDSNCVSG